MNTQQAYETAIKQIIREAMADGVVWTDKQFSQINATARDEIASETARRIYGNAR